MTEIHQRRHRGKIGERQPVADKEARRGNRAFQIVEQLRQFLRLCLRSRGEIAFAPQKARRDDAVEEYLAAARRTHRVAEFVPPTPPPALLRVGGEQQIGRAPWGATVRPYV